MKRLNMLVKLMIGPACCSADRPWRGGGGSALHPGRTALSENPADVTGGLITSRILVAGIGNIFLGDDGLAETLDSHLVACVERVAGERDLAAVAAQLDDATGAGARSGRARRGTSAAAPRPG